MRFHVPIYACVNVVPWWCFPWVNRNIPVREDCAKRVSVKAVPSCLGTLQGVWRQAEKEEREKKEREEKKGERGGEEEV